VKSCGNREINKHIKYGTFCIMDQQLNIYSELNLIEKGVINVNDKQISKSYIY